MRIFKYHAGHLFLRNDKEKRIIVLALRAQASAASSPYDIVWQYEWSQEKANNIDVIGSYQLEYSHLIHLTSKDDEKVVQLNGFKTEMIFEARWPIIR